MALTGLLLGAEVVRRTPDTLLYGFQCLDRARYTWTQGDNLFKHFVLRRCVNFALNTWSRARGQPVNQWQARRVLPTLPLPPLARTAHEARVVALRVLPDAEHERVRQECDAFLAQAWGLQLRLMYTESFHSCYAAQPWQLGAYDYNDAPLRESSHWFGVDRGDEVKNYGSFEHPECVRSAVLVHAISTYKQELLAGTCRTNLTFRFKGSQIDASTCLNAFSCRIPGKKFDTYSVNTDSQHIIVQMNGRYYKLEIVRDGQLLSVEALYAEMKAIKDDASSKGANPLDVGVFTTFNRRKWHEVREQLLTFPENAQSIGDIESALFIVHFDSEDSWRTRAEAAEFVYMCRKGFWDDITLSLRFKQGDAGLVTVCGHGNVDATGASPLVERAYELEAALKAAFDMGKVATSVGVQPCQFTLVRKDGNSLDLTPELRVVRGNVMNEGLHFRELVYTTFTKEKCKRARLNPDSVVQQAFQLAIGMTFPENPFGCETYEAVSERGFRDARTEQAHPFTPQSQTFVRRMKDEVADVDQQIEALTTSVSELSLQKREVVQGGRGHDRHLFALYVLSKVYNIEVPFLDTYINKLFHYKLSTSQLPQDFGMGGGFLPTEEHGIGIFYPIADPNEMRFMISSKLPVNVLDEFSANLKKALDGINPLLDEIIRRGAINDG